MTKLPNAVNAIIVPEKLHGYVLSPSHPVGHFKAEFFHRMGYSAEGWKLLEQDLREQILPLDVAGVQETPYGKKFVVEGPLRGPSGEKVQVVTVWVILSGENVPRFVTAYPGGMP